MIGKREHSDVQLTAAVPVDDPSLWGQWEVAFDENCGKPLDCLLNQTNIASNNNKFFVVQCVKHKTQGGKWRLLTRWGRVGDRGQSKSEDFGALSGALAAFKKKFKEKTGNNWGDDDFEPRAGKYTLLHKDYEPKEENKSGSIVDDDDDDGNPAPKKKAVVPPSSLPPAVERLIRLITDETMMAQMLQHLEYDAQKSPLGALKATTISQGSAKLKEIEQLIATTNPSKARLSALSSEYYTLIPHAFGRKAPPVISTSKQIAAEMELIRALSDVQTAAKMRKEQDPADERNPADVSYDKLQAEITPVTDAKVLEVIGQYVQSTHASTHPHNEYVLEIDQVFTIRRAADEAAFEAHAPSENRQLLWHGSRLGNWNGILSTGLRIAPPEAPITGHMFGKGLYFANSCSKSANYCHANQSKDQGVLLLCEVGLGKSFEAKKADNNLTKEKLGPGIDSTWGRGMSTVSRYETLPDRVLVPMGPLVDSGTGKTDLRYDEYVVYETSSARMRYLVLFKFHYHDKKK